MNHRTGHDRLCHLLRAHPYRVFSRYGSEIPVTQEEKPMPAVLSEPDIGFSFVFYPESKLSQLRNQQSGASVDTRIIAKLCQTEFLVSQSEQNIIIVMLCNRIK